jgi:uncharacterized protein involved in exopolysaccharide biosynthesis
VHYGFLKKTSETPAMDEQLNRPAERNAEDRTDGGSNLKEISILDYWRVIWKRRRMIGVIVVVAVFATGIISLFMTNLYQAKAVIMPVTSKDSGGTVGLAALAQQFGGLPGVLVPGSASAAEIVSLLKSNILRERIIQKYNLMPVLFFERWDAGRRIWKKDEETGHWRNPRYYVSLLDKASALVQPQGAQRKAPDIPDTWDALRLLDEIVKINQDVKQNTITISVDFHDPDMAARIVEYFLVTLTNYMSSEAKRVAATNRKYLEEQLGNTADPFIKQKTYNMIAQQIEMGMMADVKENFAFKVIDPPLAPDRKIKPQRIQMVVLSLFVALFVSVFAAFFREYIEKARARK